MTHLRQDTTLARIIALVELAQSQRAPSQAFVERFARYYTPAVIALAVRHRRRAAVRARPAFRHLVLSCAGAARDLLSVRAGDLDAGVSRVGDRDRRAQGRAHQGRRASRADRRGSVRRVRQDRNAHERCAPCRRCHSAERHRIDEILEIAAGLEARSEHPVGRAILARAVESGIALPVAVDFQSIPGRGAEAVVAGTSGARRQPPADRGARALQRRDSLEARRAGGLGPHGRARRARRAALWASSRSPIARANRRATPSRCSGVRVCDAL